MGLAALEGETHPEELGGGSAPGTSTLWDSWIDYGGSWHGRGPGCGQMMMPGRSWAQSWASPSSTCVTQGGLPTLPSVFSVSAEEINYQQVLDRQSCGGPSCPSLLAGRGTGAAQLQGPRTQRNLCVHSTPRRHLRKHTAPLVWPRCRAGGGRTLEAPPGHQHGPRRRWFGRGWVVPPSSAVSHPCQGPGGDGSWVLGLPAFSGGQASPRGPPAQPRPCQLCLQLMPWVGAGPVVLVSGV